jgi:hypothetical protein
VSSTHMRLDHKAISRPFAQAASGWDTGQSRVGPCAASISTFERRRYIVRRPRWRYSLGLQRRRLRAGERKCHVTGLAVGGHRREWGDEVARPGAPEISVRAISVFGTVDVWRVPVDMPSDYGKVIRQLQHRDRHLPT